MSKSVSSRKVAKKTAKKVAKTAVKKLPKVDCCEQCRYSKPYDEKMVMCRRYPAPAGVRDQSTMLKDGWCGEFKEGE